MQQQVADGAVEQTLVAEAGQTLRSVPLAADPRRVRRTQRIVRERAQRMRSGRARLSLAIAGCAMVCLVFAILAVPLWNALDSFAHSFGIPDLQVQMVFLAVWFLPATVIAIMLWRGQTRRPGPGAHRV